MAIDWTAYWELDAAKRREFLIKNGGHIPVSELAELPDDENIIAVWGEDGAKVVDAAGNFNLGMTMDDFLKHCTTFGGDWGNMLLSGLRELARPVWDAVPEKMGPLAFSTIVRTLNLVGVNTD